MSEVEYKRKSRLGGTNSVLPVRLIRNEVK